MEHATHVALSKRLMAHIELEPCTVGAGGNLDEMCKVQR
jgi:hypothetical protein